MRLLLSISGVAALACAGAGAGDRGAASPVTRSTAAAPAAASTAAPASPPAGTVTREERAIQVGAIVERWSLEWRRPPVPVCGPEDVEGAITCPCIGFAYGEMGELDMVRRRPGRPDERLALTPLFRDGENPAWERELAVLQRWPMSPSDFGSADSADPAPPIRARQDAPVIATGDYDHDGRPTEFLLQVGTLPCGKRQAVLIGVSGADSSLHAFTSVAHPERPLVLETYLWDRLLRSDGRVTSVRWPCGDHGSETQTEVELRAGPAGIDGTRSEYACAESRTRGRRLSSERL